MLRYATPLMVLLLTGCASQSPTLSADDPMAKALEGKPVQFVEQKLGLPLQRKELPTGAMIWTYHDNDEGMMAQECSLSLSIRNDTVEHVSMTTQFRSLFSAVATPCANLRQKLR